MEIAQWLFRKGISTMGFEHSELQKQGAAVDHQQAAAAFDPGLMSEAQAAQAGSAVGTVGRIIGLSVEGDNTVFMVAKHAKDPVGGPGAPGGYIVGSGVPFTIRSVSPDQRIVHIVAHKSSNHFYDVDGKPTAETAVFDAVEKPPEDESKARVIGVSVEGAGVRIMLGLGAQTGAMVGMSGQLITRNGTPLPRGTFTIDRVGPRISWAFLKMTVDQVQQCDVAFLSAAPAAGPVEEPVTPKNIIL
jgi:hypothetical protein